MGMYTELCFNAEVERDAPKYVVDVLRWMAAPTDTKPDFDPADEPLAALMATPRVGLLFTCDSYYFPHDTTQHVRYDDIAGTWFVNVHSNLKNYDGEIGLFLTWIKPYVRGNFLGYYRYEEHDEPTLIYRDPEEVDGRV